jgi:predicted transglutaminase-like cysteine proteinase
MTLKEIFRLVKSNFTYKTDKSQYDKIEYWVEPSEDYDGSQPVIGDCEDFALACRKLCRDNGIATRLVYCKDEFQQGHLVLEHKGYVLDNRQDNVESIQYLARRGYKFISISGERPGDPWLAIK